jgi:hypothetical protein
LGRDTKKSLNCSSSSGDYATVAYDTDGNQLWVATHDYGSARSVAIDSSGNVCVAGYSYDGGSEYVMVLSDKDREEYEQRLQKYPPEIRESFFIPDAFPPFRDIVALGDKWLFIQTYDEPNEGSSVYDIFNTNGEFTGRTELEDYQVKFKGDRVYCLK